MFIEASLLFIFGLVIGSFLNVVAFRYSEEKSLFSLASLGGRSHCQHCHKNLAWYELVPVLSFLAQGGHCRSCQKNISWQYPLMELASGFVFLLPLYLYNPIIPNSFPLFQSAIWILAFLTFLLIWSIDFRLYLIPDELNLFLGILGIALIGIQKFYGYFGEFSGSFLGSYAGLFGWRSNIWFNHFGAMAIGAAIVGAIILLTRGRGMGFGDLKLLAALGLLFGWPDIILVFILAAVIGSLASFWLLALKKKNFQSSIPFGPFLTIGATLVFFFGETILRGYFSIFNL